MAYLTALSFPGFGKSVAFPMCGSNGNVENHDQRRTFGATMDAARPGVGTVGRSTQVELEENRGSAGNTEVCRRFDRGDFCQSRRGTRVDDDDEELCRICGEG